MEEKHEMKKPKSNHAISVIVPVYKVEPYLRQCVDSILAQTFTDFELILVDDGSPDNCGVICDEYAAKDDRIVVIHQENGGVSAARNAGLDWVFANSDSQWITFVDSDDCLVSTFLEHLWKYAVDTGSDIVTTHGHWFVADVELDEAPMHVSASTTIPGKKCCLSFYANEMLCSAFAWGKLYRKSLFHNNRYATGKLFEDEELTPRLLFESETITILRAWLYCYRQRNGSIVHEKFTMRRYDHLDAMQSCRAYFLRQGENQIVCALEKRMKLYIAKYMLLAQGAGMADSVPAEYRMPLWKAFCISVADTLSHGGMDFVAQRIKNYFGRIKRN